MPQDYINNVFGTYQEPKRTTRPPIEALAKHIPPSMTGTNPFFAVPVMSAAQAQLAKGGKVSRGAGRVLGEGQMYYDSAVQLLRLLDSDIPESERANALAMIATPLGVNMAKDLAMARASKGKPQTAAAFNTATDFANIPIGSELSKLLTRPLGEGNQSVAQVIHQLGQVIPGIPTHQNLIELAAKMNVARQPWVKKLKTGLEYSTENVNDVLDEDEILLQLARLSDNKNAPVTRSLGKYAPSNNSRTAKTNAQFLNDIGKLMKLKYNIVNSIGPSVEKFATNPSGTIAAATKPSGTTTRPTPIGMGKLPTASELRMQR